MILGEGNEEERSQKREVAGLIARLGSVSTFGKIKKEVKCNFTQELESGHVFYMIFIQVGILLYLRVTRPISSRVSNFYPMGALHASYDAQKSIICRNWRSREGSCELGSSPHSLEMKHYLPILICYLPSCRGTKKQDLSHRYCSSYPTKRKACAVSHR